MGIVSEIWGEWNKLSGWVVSVESMNHCKGNLDHHLRDNRGFK